MECADPPLEGPLKGVGAPHQCPLKVSIKLPLPLFMLTCGSKFQWLIVMIGTYRTWHSFVQRTIRKPNEFNHGQQFKNNQWKQSLSCWERRPASKLARIHLDSFRSCVRHSTVHTLFFFYFILLLLLSHFLWNVFLNFCEMFVLVVMIVGFHLPLTKLTKLTNGLFGHDDVMTTLRTPLHHFACTCYFKI